MHALSAKSLPLLSRYDALVSARAIERDPAQLAALGALERLAKDLMRRAPAAGFWSYFKRPRPLRGVYLWGHVGRGKTTLMDLFFDAAPVENKRRVHFHAFMAEVHRRLHEARRNCDGASDPVSKLAQALAGEAGLLCFDEFSVFDIADATILARLFKALFAAGVVVVATSNVEPHRLYEGGRNRDLFLPFIVLLQERMEVVRLDARADFRLRKQCVGEVFFRTDDDERKAAAQAQLDAYLGRAQAPARICVNGREVEIPQAGGGVGRFTFRDICGKPLGAADYLALTKNFDTIIIEDVPAMGYDRRNEAKRFITLVDILYEAKTKLVLCAEAEAEDLYRADHGAEALEFPRTVSRLTEMRSREYLDQWAAGRS